MASREWLSVKMLWISYTTFDLLYNLLHNIQFVVDWLYRVFQKTVPLPLFYFCDNFRKCAPILTIFSLVEQEIYDA